MTHTLTAPSYHQLATMTVSDLLRLAVDLEAPGLIPANTFEEAATIQRQLIVIAAFKRDVHDGGPLASLLSQRGRDALVAAPLSHFLMPATCILDTFAHAYLSDPAYPFSPLLTIALIQQNANAVPPEVPSIGIILSSPSAALGADGRALFDRDTVRAALIVTACCRALLPPDRLATPHETRAEPAAPDPRSHSQFRRYPADTGYELGFAVRSAQLIANAVLSGAQTPDQPTHSVILGYLQLAERRFRRDGFDGLADLLSRLRKFNPIPVRSPAPPHLSAAP